MNSRCLPANPFEADHIFHLLTQMHEGKSTQESVELNARLILCLINHIGDSSIIARAVEAASGGHP